MNFHSESARPSTLLDDPYMQHPDTAEQTVLTAVRTWLRPQCNVVRQEGDWREMLTEAGMTRDGLEHFDVLMSSLMCSTCRPLDTRCRCASDLANDEASLLQTIALLQSTQSEAAMRLLNDWLPQVAVRGMLKIARWFAIALLDAGLELRVRRRRVSYMH